MRRKNIVQLAVIASGSSGNAALLQMNGTNILVDAGISAKRLTQGIGAFNLLPEHLDGIVITHEHTDHIQGLGVLLKKNRIPLYCRPDTGREILRKFPDISGCIVGIGENFGVGNVSCESFSINHDAADPVGFNFYCGRMKVSYCTDVGKMTGSVRDKLAGSDILVLESNHDPDLLRKGPYPEFLKKRIAGSHGHLSNSEAGETLVKLQRKPKSVVFLAHLSKENNTPDVASSTVRKKLSEYNVCCVNEVQLMMTWPDMISSCALENA